MRNFVPVLMVLSIASCDGATGEADDDVAADDAIADDTPTDDGLDSPDAPMMDGAPAEPSTGCGRAPGAADQVVEVDHDGRTRTANVHLPTGYASSTPAPVVINFHGRNSTASQQQALSGMNAKANAESFIAVHPQGVGNTWNAGRCCGDAMTGNVDDVGFISALIDTLEKTYCIDTSRIYATGLSNGGFMAHRLACDRADLVAAIAPVAGGDMTTACAPSRPVPVLHFHGTSDNVVPFEGFGGFASIPQTMDAWSRRNSCTPGRATYLQTGDVTCEDWASSCAQGSQVRLCRVDGGGHQWPGGLTIPGLGHNTSAISATDEMWSFFAQ